MNKYINFFKTFCFVLFWLAISSYLEKYWRIIHWEYIYINTRIVFDHIFWFTLKKFLFEFDLGFYFEELLKFATYELPKEIFKYFPIYLFIRLTWKKKSKK